jgi:LysR family glycine cleavage system transcriptional activator
VPSALVVDDLAAGRLVVPLSVAGVHVRDYAYVIAPVERNPHLITAFCAWLDEQGSSSNQLASEVLAAASGPSSGST